MAPRPWATEAETEWLQLQLPAYLKAQENQHKVPLTRFWKSLDKAFFKLFPPEAVLKRDPPADGVPPTPLTPEQKAIVGKETAVVKKRLKAWMRYRERPNVAAGSTRKNQASLFKLLEPVKSTRAYRPVEIYQKLYGPKIKDAVKERGYDDLTEEADAAANAGASASRRGVVLTEEEEDDAEEEEVLLAAKKRSLLRSARMGLWQGTAREMWKRESPEVVLKVEKATEEANARRTDGKVDPEEEITPQAMQHGIDQIAAVFAKVHDLVLERTGWYGVTLLGGPMPRRDGQISTKTICFGESENGNDFAAAHPNFDSAVKIPFVSWLKLVFPHDVRDARALPNENTEIPEQPEGLIPLDFQSDDDKDAEEDDEEIPPAPTSSSSSARRSARPTATPFQAPAASATGTASVPAPVTPTATAPARATAAPAIVVPGDIPNATTPAHAASPPLPEAPSSPCAVPDFAPPAGFDDFLIQDINEDMGNPFDYDAELADVLRRNDELASLTEGRAAVSGAAADRDSLTFPAPSALFQAFVHGPRRTPSSTSSPVTGFRFGRPASSEHTAFTFTPSTPAVTPSGDRLASVNVTPTPISSVANTTPAPSSTPPRPPATDVPNAHSAASTTPRTSPAAHSPVGSASSTPPNPPSSHVPNVRPAASTTPRALPTQPPASDVHVPQFPPSRPMANAPRGHPLAPAPKAAAASKVKTKAKTKAKGGKPRGRPRKGGVEDEMEGAVVGDDENSAPNLAAASLSGAAAQAESARIRRDAANLRKQQVEQLRRAREIEEGAAAALPAKRKRGAVAEPGVVVVPASKRARRSAQNPDGSDVMIPVKGRRGELRGGARLGRAVDLDAEQAKDDAELVEKLGRGKRKVGRAAGKAPVKKRGRN